MLKNILQYLGGHKLHKATQLDNIPRMRKLIEAGADVNEPGPQGATPLFFTANLGSVQAAKILLNNGAKIDAAIKEGGTTLHSALLKNHEDLTIFLLDNGANPNKATQAGVTPLHLAALGGMTPVVSRLLRGGANIRALTGQKQGIIYCAMAGMTFRHADDASCLSLLFASGADPRDGADVLRDNLEGFSEDARNALRKELDALAQKTENAELRDFIRRFRGHMDGALLSPLLGSLTRSDDKEFRDWWYSEPRATPFWDRKKIPFVYVFEPDEDTEFIAAADAAVKSFLKLAVDDRLQLTPLLEENCREVCKDAGYGKEVAQWLDAGNAAALWDSVSPPESILVQRRHRRDKDIYIQMRMDCKWERENGLQMVFRKGLALTRISVMDGWLTDADAYGLEDSEDKLLSRFCKKSK